MRTLLVVLVALGLTSSLACQSAKPTRTSHGWRTHRVVAVRYHNDLVGYNIGFNFPLNPNEADCGELDDFMKAHGGFIYEGGGYPGATMYVIFKDVKDRESADRKLQEILPALDKLVGSLR